MYYLDGRVRYSEVDSERKMTITALLNYFQDCCTFQSEDMGVGIDYLSGENAAWVLISWQVVVKRKPMFAEKIQIATWPYDFGGFYGFRNFVMKNAQGEVLAYANSVWAFVDMESGRPRKILPKIHEIYQVEPKFEMDYKSRKLQIPAERENQQPFEVHSSLIDTNNHVNNERYIEIAKAYLPGGYDIHQMRVEYRKSAVLGDVIYPSVHREAGTIMVVLADEQQKPYVVVEFEEAE